MMDAIFKALNDPARRALLDSLRQKDGQTLSELETQLDMTRFGVMKHLGVLEDASLITTRKVGRFKHHYLNAVPLQEVIDRWIEPLLSKPVARGMIDLKNRLETEEMNAMSEIETKPDFVQQTFIRTTPARLWRALTDGEMTRQYYIAQSAVEGTVAVGERLVWKAPDGTPLLSGEVLEADEPHKLSLTFEPHWGEEMKASRMSYLIEAEGEVCKLTIEHFDIPEGLEGVKEGWARIASALKTLLETGEALNVQSMG